MAEITAKLVKELRDMTGVGMMDAKKALVAVDGDMDKAVDFLREKGLASAGKKADRIAAEGTTAIYVDGNTAALIEVNAETDFVTRNDQFKELVATLAETIAKTQPADLEAALALDVNGETVENLIINAINTIGEKISLRRFEIYTKTDNDAFGTYVHTDGSIGVLTLIEGTTDEAVAKDIAMHIAA